MEGGGALAWVRVDGRHAGGGQSDRGIFLARAASVSNALWHISTAGSISISCADSSLHILISYTTLAQKYHGWGGGM